MKYGKALLLGLVIWAIPFFTSFFFWDVENGIPSVSLKWFSAIMAFTWSIGFAIALYYYFVKYKPKTCEGIKVGLLWYVELLLLEYIFLVLVFGMTMSEYNPMFLSYLTVVPISIAVAYLKK